MFKNIKNKLITVAAMMILSMSAWQTKGMIMAPSSIALPFVKLVSWGAQKVKDGCLVGYEKAKYLYLKKLGITLRIAFEKEMFESAELLLRNGENEGINDLIGRHENTLLNIACKAGKYKLVDLLLKNGLKASINKSDVLGFTSLHHACCLQNFELIRLLLDNGAIINKRDSYSCTPLHIASGYSSVHIVRFLLDNGASIDIQANGETPFHRACKAGNIEVLRFFLENNYWNIESVNKQVDYEETPLHLACSSFGDSKGNNLETVRFLLENGALESINEQNSLGMTPVQLTRNQDIINLLNLVSNLQMSPDKVAFIKNVRLVRKEDFEFLVKVLRSDLLVQLAKPEAKEKEKFVIEQSDFNALLKDNRLTEEEKRKIEEILDLQGAPKCKLDNLNFYDYMCQYAKGRLPEVYKAMKRLQFQESSIERCSDCEVVV